MAGVDQAVVDLVADHQQIVALGDPGQGTDAIGLKHGAGRIVGKADEERLGARRDGRLDRLGVQLPAVVRRAGHVDRDTAGKDDVGHVGDIRGLGHDDLVTRVDHGGQRHRQRLGRTHRDDHLGVRVVGHVVAAP